MHKWKEELRIEKNGRGMSWDTCRKADYLDDYATVVIGKPERHVRKASHCGSKQQ